MIRFIPSNGSTSSKIIIRKQQQQQQSKQQQQQQQCFFVLFRTTTTKTTTTTTTITTTTNIQQQKQQRKHQQHQQPQQQKQQRQHFKTGKIVPYPNMTVVTRHNNRHCSINSSQNKMPLSYSYFIPIVNNTFNNYTYQYRYYSNTSFGHYSASTNRTSSCNNDITNDDIPYILADIGEGIKEVEIIAWYVAINDTIQQFDKVCVVQSDKATVEITSRYDGTIKSLLNKKVGDIIQVGQPLLYLYNNNTNSSTTFKVIESKMTPTDTPIIDDSLSQSPFNKANAEVIDNTINDTISNSINNNNHKEPVLVAVTNNDTQDERSEKYYFPSISSKFEASPAVRKLVKQYGLLHNRDTNDNNNNDKNDNIVLSIQGTGPKGRILKHDVEKHLQERGIHIKKPSSQQQQDKQEVTTMNTDSNTTKSNEHGNDTLDATNKNDTNNDAIITLKGYNRLMYKTMSQSVSIPTMGFADEIIMNEIQTFHTSMNQQYLETSTRSTNINKNNIKISMLAILIKICSISLNEYPIINSIIHDDTKMELKICTSHNIGIAMQTQRGLIVPVLHNCQLLSIIEIQEQLNYYKECGKNNTFTTDELSNSTFTISNIGSMNAGGTYMKPILLHPTIVIGALGMIQPPVPRYKNPTVSTCTSTIYPATIMPISWSADHRYLDGATLAQFSYTIKQYIENPYRLLSKLK